MGKNYRYITLTPQELACWADNFKLSLVNIGTRADMKRDIERVKSLANNNNGNPFLVPVLAKYLVEGKEKHRVIYGARLISAILSIIANASESEKVTQKFKEFARYEFKVLVIEDDRDANGYLFEAFNGFNRKG